MILRQYQATMVDKSIAALKERGNTLAVAPTGAGKTIILSAVAGRLGGKQVILQHRDELVSQNSEKFRLVNPGVQTGLYNADLKDWRMPVTFAMVQTLARHLRDMPKLDALIIDEAHHAVARSYREIVEHARALNPDCLIYGVTATPARGDKKGLRPVFDNCASSISLPYLISQGFLVKPRLFTLTLGSETDAKLASLSKTLSGEYDMEEADAALNTVANNDLVFQHWQKLAYERKTIIFCSTVNHARTVCELFRAKGVNSALIDGAMNEPERKRILADFDSQEPGSIQVLCNVAVLTEGYDSQPVSCVVLLRPCSRKPTMIQMIGRGLRKVDPAVYPNVIKKDCLVLDFGNSLDSHGLDLNLAVQLDDKPVFCEFCNSEIPAGSNPCPLCGADRTPEKGSGAGSGKDEIRAGEMIEREFLNESPFSWCDLFGSGRVMIANGFMSFCAVVSPDGENWLALGREKDSSHMDLLAAGEKIACLASADDYFRCHEDISSVRKNRKWMKDVCSERQWQLLLKAGYGEAERLNFNKYNAACALNFHWNRSRIEGAMRRAGCQF